MKRVITDAVIYKVSKYSDRAAICQAFTKDLGKVKLFVNKAYNKSSSIQQFVPGSLNFLIRENTDLNKYYDFNASAEYSPYVDNSAIFLRLYIMFEILDSLYGELDVDLALWKIICSYTSGRPEKVLLFGIYTMLQNSGIMFDMSACTKCGCIFEEYHLTNSNIVCVECFKTEKDKNIFMKKNVVFLMKTFSNKELFKSTDFSASDEMDMLNVLCRYVAQHSGRTIKSFQMFQSL